MPDCKPLNTPSTTIAMLWSYWRFLFIKIVICTLNFNVISACFCFFNISNGLLMISLFVSTGRDRTLQDKALRKNAVKVVYIKEMLLAPLVSRQIPKLLLSSDQITQHCLIIALFPIHLATWLMKTHGRKWTKVTWRTLIHFKWLLQENFSHFLPMT